MLALLAARGLDDAGACILEASWAAAPEVVLRLCRFWCKTPVTYHVYKVSREHPNEKVKIDSSASLTRLVLLLRYLLNDPNAYDLVVTSRNEKSM